MKKENFEEDIIKQEEIIKLFLDMIDLTENLLNKFNKKTVLQLSGKIGLTIKFLKENPQCGEIINLGMIFEFCQNYISQVTQFSDDDLQILEFAQKLENLSSTLFTQLNYGHKNKLDYLELEKLKELFSVRIFTYEMEDLTEFIYMIIEFITKHEIKLILSTEKSARVIGILLNFALKELGIKDVKIIAFVPDKIVREFTKNYPQLITKFAKEKQATYKRILNKKILIVDEYSHTGVTFKKSKVFFKKMGASQVFTAVFYASHEFKQNMPDVFLPYDFNKLYRLNGPSWYNKAIMLRKEPDFKTRLFKPVIHKIRYDLLNKKAKELKQKIIWQLKEHFRERQI